MVSILSAFHFPKRPQQRGHARFAAANIAEDWLAVALLGERVKAGRFIDKLSIHKFAG